MRKHKNAPAILLLTALSAAAGVTARAAAPKAMIVLTSATYDSGALDDRAMALATDSAGNVFVTGSSGNDYLSIKYNKGLVQGPAQLYSNGRSGNVPGGIAVDGLGNIVVAGMEMNASSKQNYLVLRYSPNFASQISSASYNGGIFDKAVAVKTDNQNNIFVTGYTSDGTTENFYTIKYGPALNTLAAASYESGYTDLAAGLAITANNDVIVVGYTREGGTNYNFRTVKYDSELNQLTSRSFDSGGDERATAVAVDSAGDIIVAGRQNNGTLDYCTLKYDGFLNLLSSAVYDSGGMDTPTGVATDSGGNIIVTGYTAGDYLTIKYDRDLNLVSTAAYDGGPDDKSNAVAVDADDNVIVTGHSLGATYNYFTIKYNASPKITEVSPLYIGETANVVLKGKGFLTSSVVSFAAPTIATGAIVAEPLQITVEAAPSMATPLGLTTATVTNVNGETASYYLAETRLRKTVPAGQSETISAMTKLGQVTVAVPAGAFPQQETLTLYPVPAAPGEIQQVGEGLFIAGTPSTSSLLNLSVTLRYSAADLAGYPESGLSLAYYDPAGGWITLPTSLNTAAKSVTGTAKAANNRYAVIKQAPGGGGGGGGGGGSGGSGIPAKVYPNPYRPGSGGSFDRSPMGDGIVFAGLGAGQSFKLTITDLAGQMVFQKAAAADGAGKYFWDTKTASGGKAASGVYIYIVTGGGEPRKGKFSIIR